MKNRIYKVEKLQTKIILKHFFYASYFINN